jgi:Isoprenylcysteine carboxyl methyltransferase (ICMT) family
MLLNSRSLMSLLRRRLHTTAFWTLVAAVLGAGGMLLFLRLAPNALPAASTPASLDALGLPARILVSAGIWALFGVYWSLAARGAAAPQQAESRGSRWAHLGLTNVAQLVLLLPIPGLRWRFLPLTTPVVVAGFAVQIAGLLLAVWARQTLGRFWSGAIATSTDHQLIRGGPYRLVRHPIYTALLGMYLGTALISGELHGWWAWRWPWPPIGARSGWKSSTWARCGTRRAPACSKRRPARQSHAPFHCRRMTNGVDTCGFGR